MRHFLLILLLCTVLLPSSHPITAQDDELAPYLYYYSSQYNAFVIERADGTDSRLLGNELMPPDTAGIGGPGWSPTGRWFAWFGVVLDGLYSGGDRMLGTMYPYAVYVDGTRRAELLDQFSDVHLTWSPVEDLLLAVDLASDDEIQTVTVIDVEQNVVLLSFEPPFEKFNGDLSRSIHAEWTADGQRLIMYRDNETSTDLWIVDVHGTGNTPITTDSELISLSPAGNSVYYLNDILSVKNLLSGTTHEFALPASRTPQVYWNHAGTQALVEAVQEGRVTELWLLIPDENHMELIEPNNHSIEYGPTDYWSPDDQWFVYWSDDGAFHTRNRAITTAPPDNDIDSLYLIRGNDVQWVSNTKAIISDYDLETEQVFICLMDIPTATRIACVSEDTHIDPSFSPNGEILAYFLEEVIIGDLTSGEEIVIPPDSHRRYHPFENWTKVGGEILWYESDWFIILRSGLIGHRSGYYAAVVGTDGTGYRELGHVGYSEADINWLPPRVESAWLPPINYSPVPQPQPRTILHGSLWPLYLSWSPDGQQIAAGWDYYRDVLTTVWDLETEQHREVTNAGRWVPTLWIPVGDRYKPLASEIDNEDELTPFTPEEMQALGDLISPVGGYYPYIQSYDRERQLLAISNGNVVQIWDVETRALRGELPVSSMALAFSPDGTQLAIARSWNIEIYDVADLLR